MLDFFRKLFGTDFMPHLYCLRGEPGVLWLQVLSDLAIAAAYFAIPLVLLRVVLKRKEVLFRQVAVLFVLFIAACGTTHLLEVWTIWYPMYRLEGVVKALTAVFSIATALVLLRLRAQIEQLPSVGELEREIEERRSAEEKAHEINERFRTYVEGVKDHAIFMMSPEGIVQSWNLGAERIKGYKAEEIVGRHFSRFYTPEEIAAGEPAEAIRTATESGHYEKEGWRLRKDGTRFWANVQIRPSRDASGRLEGFTKITRDLTEPRAMEARFQALIEAAPDAIVIVRMDGNIEFANTGAEKLFGFDRKEILGKQVDMLVPPRVREVQAAYLATLFEETAHPLPTVPPEILGMRKDGSEFPLEFSVSALETDEGRLLLFAIRDLTERRRADERFRVLLEAAPDAILITSRPGRIVYMNRRAEAIFGYSRAALVGKLVETLTPERFHRELAQEREARFLSPESDPAGYGGEHAYLRRDGSEFLAEVSRSPLETADGTVMLTSVRDITERKKSEMRFRNLLESAPDAMVIVNSEGVIQLANIQTEKLFGYSRAELVGQPVDNLVPENRRAGHPGHRSHFFADPRPREMGAGLDLTALRRDGTQFPVEISLSPLEGPDGTSVTAAIRDVTERKLVAAQLAEKMNELRHSNEALEQFAHIASHDLQEPLRMVASYTQLISRRYKGRLDSDADEFIAYAVDGTQRMKRLIEDLLLYSRAGKGSPPVRSFCAEEALQEAIRNLCAAVEESGAEVTFDPLPWIVAADVPLAQVFQNLIGNAIKYRGDRVPKIHVSAEKDNREWVFSVADNGIGIEPRYFDRIFEIFQRLHGRGEYEGTGIGLALCKRILQQQGGRIWVESVPGEGSTFHFALPVR